MINFFRKIRQQLLTENKPAFAAGRYLKYAIGEIILVVMGILIALSINNWNENRKERLQEQIILKGLQYDLRLDVSNLNKQFKTKEGDLESFINCLEILTTDNQATKAQFMDNFEWILDVGGFSQSKTTFNNLQTSGQISFIKNKVILDSIINYYNSRIDLGETAMRDYTRNIVAPYLFEFDYIPSHETMYRNKRLAKASNPDSYIMSGKSLEDYKQDYFIINALRKKGQFLERLMGNYEILIKKADRLDSLIQTYLENL